MPSLTLLLFDLGLEKRTIGRTKFCIHPRAKVQAIEKVGGTKNLNLERIKLLQPDLIIANKEENERAQIESLQKDFNVLVTDINDLTSNYEAIELIGKITQTELRASTIIEETKHNFAKLPNFKQKTVAYFIWRKPYMVAGSQTFINYLLEQIGCKNIFNHLERYPIIAAKDLQLASPDLILLSSEPYPFKIKHIAELQAICPTSKIILVDGELFSWYGSKMMAAPEYFRELAED